MTSHTPRLLNRDHLGRHARRNIDGHDAAALVNIEAGMQHRGRHACLPRVRRACTMACTTATIHWPSQQHQWMVVAVALVNIEAGMHDGAQQWNIQACTAPACLTIHTLCVTLCACLECACLTTQACTAPRWSCLHGDHAGMRSATTMNGRRACLPRC